MTIYNLSETPVAVSYFPTGTPVEITLRDMTGAIIPISNNVCVESPAGSEIFTWSFADIIDKPTVGLRGYWEMVATDSSYPLSREQFQWGVVTDKEVVLGYFPEGKTITISLWDIEGTALPVNANSCTPLANDLDIYAWSFDDLTTYPDGVLRGYWEMKTHDASYPDAMDNFVVNLPQEVLEGLEYRSIDSAVILKSEFCLYEENTKTLKIRLKFPSIVPPDTDDFLPSQILSAKIVTYHGFEYILPWNEVVQIAQTKIIKQIDLTTVTFLDGDLPLGIGEHILEVTYGIDVQLIRFKVVPITVESIKAQYMLGIELQSKAELVFQQDLRKITGVNVLQISRETPVGSKELIWDAANSTLQWDNGEQVVISDDYTEYHLSNYMSVPGITDGDYIKVEIEDIDDLPVADQTEEVLVDVKKYEIEEYQYWINNGYRVVTESIIMTDIEPTLYSSDKSLTGYKYLDPVMNMPKNFSETKNISFEFAINQLQEVIELWAHHRGAEKVNIDLERVEHSTDGQIVVRGFPNFAGIGGNMSTIGLAGLWDRTIYSKNHPGARNKTKNFWQGTVIAGIKEKGLRELVLDVAAKIAAIDLLIQAGLGKGAGISSRSFSVGGINSAYTTTESAENSLYSGIILDLQKRLGTGRATKDEQRNGLIASLKRKIEGGSMSFKY